MSTPSPRTLGPETWGQRLRRAYLLFRDEHGLTYRDVAERCQEVGLPISHAGVAALAEWDELPPHPSTRRNAMWVVLAYGFDPAEWDLDGDTVDLFAYDLDKLRAALHPASWADDARARTGRQPRAGRRKSVTSSSDAPAAAQRRSG